MRKTLLAAKSIAYSDSSSGTYLSTVGFKKLGVADEIAGKTRKVRGPPSGEPVAAVVARGEAEIGFQQVAELINVPGADFVGTVPAEIQPPTFFVGALPKGSQQPDAAVALLRFLSSAEAAAVITKAGLKPLARALKASGCAASAASGTIEARSAACARFGRHTFTIPKRSGCARYSRLIASRVR